MMDSARANTTAAQAQKAALHVINQQEIQKRLEENQIYIRNAFECQNDRSRHQEGLQLLKKIHQTLTVLSELADRQPNTQAVLRECREIASQRDIRESCCKLPMSISSFNMTDKPDKEKITEDEAVVDTADLKKTKVIQKWTEEEKKLFEEGLKKYGHKELRKVTDHIGGSRTIYQVRSYHQKYVIRKQKEFRARKAAITAASLTASKNVTKVTSTKGKSSIQQIPDNEVQKQATAPENLAKTNSGEVVIIDKTKTQS
mmetsp:Transcript_44368/g.51112  ORF Transcript_44368/g.51112 Transcript_44368/m.51112 type:complete len:258 (+) Transcript_44368:28-801(+)